MLHIVSLIQVVSLFLVLTTAATVTVTEAPSVPSTALQYTSNALFTSAILNSTNFFRTEHNASWIYWNETLEDFASSYLNNDSDCDFAHSGGPYGENIAIGCSDVTGCVDLWGDEREKYNWNDPGFSEKTGHFSQLVWKNTTTLGCGRKLCGTSSWFLVCEYWPRGNVIGEFKEEVGRQINGTGSFAPVIRAPLGVATLVWEVLVVGALTLLL